MNRFSALNRPALINELKENEYDVLIIGGGVTGAGIALDAATRGMKTALFEMKDFAWGTSSRSTKLIHGGLRYLKQFELGLVREVGTERAIVHQNARHIVLPEKMLLPIVEGGSLGGFMTSMGLWVYDFLAGVDDDEKRKMLSKDKTLASEPLLRKDIVKGGGLYFEYRSDDARLTIEIVKKAVEQGALCLNYSKVIKFLYKNNKIEGLVFEDTLTGIQHEVKAKRIINATGPWVDKVRKIDEEKLNGKKLHLTKGVHLVIPYEKLPLQQSVYFDVENDSRMIFAIPRGKITYVGTTDTNYSGKTGHPQTTLADVEYVLEAVNFMFPQNKITVEDVVSSWAGLRPLIHEEGKDPSELSRKDEIFLSDNGLVSIAGGKLTGYRKMAERVMDLVVQQIEKAHPDLDFPDRCQTKNVRVSGGDFESQEALFQYIEKKQGECTQIQAPPAIIKDLVFKYGTNTDIIIERAFEIYPETDDPVRRLHLAEVWYGVHFEMCHSLSDYLIRRTGRLYFERPELEKLYPFLADVMGEILQWTEEEKEKQLKDFEKSYAEVLDFC